MKRLLIIVFVILSFSAVTKSQYYDSIQTSSLNIHNSAPYSFFITPDGYAGFNFDSSAVIYTADFWLSGKVDTSFFNGAVLFENPLTSSSMQWGPVMTDTLLYQTTTTQFNRQWKVTRDEIYWHQTNFTQSGYVVPQPIAEWPGNAPAGASDGNVLAPYYDYNGDNFYNPADGDFPLIKGDEAIFLVRNFDKYYSPNEARMKVEEQLLLYIFNCSPDSALQRTLFLDVKMINHDTTDIMEMYAGVWTDFDIGFSADDFIGTDVKHGLVCGFNGDNIDEPGNGQAGYGIHIPACGTMILSGANADYDGIDNPLTASISDCIDSSGIPYASLGRGYGDGIIDNEKLGMTNSLYFYRNDQTPGPAQSEPADAISFYRYLSSTWLDGTPVYYGGTGHQSSAGAQLNGLTPAKYMYPGNTDPLLFGTAGIPVGNPSTWTEADEGNTPADRRMICSSGPFTLSAGETDYFSAAFVTGRDYINNGAMPGIPVMQRYADTIRYYFEHDTVPCYNSFTVGVNSPLPQQLFDQLVIYPNPAADVVRLVLDNQNPNSKIELFTVQGKLLMTQVVNSDTEYLNVSSLPDGIYFVRIINIDQTQLIQKLIIAH